MSISSGKKHRSDVTKACKAWMPTSQEWTGSSFPLYQGNIIAVHWVLLLCSSVDTLDLFSVFPSHFEKSKAWNKVVTKKLLWKVSVSLGVNLCLENVNSD